MVHQEEDKHVQEIAKAVCVEMQGDWRVSDTWKGNGVMLVSGEKTLHFRLLWNDKSRLVISGSFPRGLSQYLPYGDQREKTEITVTVKKTQEQIAKSIRSRLMEPYKRMLEHCLERKKKDDEYKAKKKAALKAVAKACNTEAGEGSVVCYKPYVRAKYWSDGDIELEVRVSLDKALEIISQLVK